MARCLPRLALLVTAVTLLAALPAVAQTSSTSGTTTSSTMTTHPGPSSSSSMTTHSDPDPYPPQATQASTGTDDGISYDGWVEVVPGSIALSVGRPQAGDDVTVYVRLRNTSGQSIRADCDIVLIEAATDWASMDHQELALGPHEERVCDRPWTPARDGRFEAHVTAKHVRAPAPQPVIAAFYVGGSGSGPQLLLTTGLTNLGNLERGESRTIPVSLTAYNADHEDVRLVVLESGRLDVQVLTPAVDIPAGSTVQAFLRVTAASQENATAAESRRILLQAESPTGDSNVESINLVLHERDFLGIPWLSPPLAAGAVGAGAALAATFRRHA